MDKLSILCHNWISFKTRLDKEQWKYSDLLSTCHGHFKFIDPVLHFYKIADTYVSQGLKTA